MISEENREKLGPVLGRVPSGVFILVAGTNDGRQTGLLASWVQQASFEPPQITVAVNKSRYLNDWLVAGSAVTINQIAKGDSILFKHFGKGFEPDVDAFAGVESVTGAEGLPLLTAAMSSMEGRVMSHMEAGDHLIYLVDLTSATVHQELSASEPFVHVRRNGFSY